MPDTLENNLTNRDRLLDALASEIFGPESHLAVEETQKLPRPGKDYEVNSQISFPDWDGFNQFSSEQRRDKKTGQEILVGESPLQRYGTGVLFPASDDDGDDSAEAVEASRPINAAQNKAASDQDQCPDGEGENDETKPPDDSFKDRSRPEDDVHLSNLKKQRSIGVSFVVANQSNSCTAIIRGGYYVSSTVTLGTEGEQGRSQQLWTRHAFEEKIEFTPDDEVIKVGVESAPHLALELTIHRRDRTQLPDDQGYPDEASLLTVCLVNRGSVASYRDFTDTNRRCLFQAELSIQSSESTTGFLHYPEPAGIQGDDELRSFQLLYRNEKTYATGHGAAGTWDIGDRDLPPRWVKAEVLPIYETPGITPEVEFDGEKVKISLRLLSKLSDGDGLGKLASLVGLYEKWIVAKDESAKSLETPVLRETAYRHVKEMRSALARMGAGLDLLTSDVEARRIFEWTNRAILLQSAVCKNIREPDDLGHWNFSHHFDPVQELETQKERFWRPFQIAFLLMNLPGLHDEDSADREIVDLIWFPTGGGKTEAYLACAAYSMFRRRQRDKTDTGTDVIMRYTLRLLTAQQFERASALICAMETIRQPNLETLGKDPFTIGIWVGGSTTPNKFSEKQAHPDFYNMVLLKCPWCGAKMGPKQKGKSYSIAGYSGKGMNGSFACPDHKCHFHERLPLHVIDEYLYENPPTYLIATVDKFAMLAWNELPRSFFGIGRDGKPLRNPPGLIIQDELHLITGPLGSMVGLYETVIAELCSKRPDGKTAVPKLVAATATTRASARQISDLYARPRSGVFPPPGLDADDSFFARYDTEEDGSRKPARRYLGVLGLNYSSALTTSIRMTTALHTAAWLLEKDERDPWWTLLYFYNSIRELGGGLSIYDSDISERLGDVQRRWIGKFDKETQNYRSKYFRFRELTGRLQNSEIPTTLKELEQTYDAEKNKALDACLASNIIEVGVDVDRLSLMAIQGQPKTTAQYIQATGRIGRNSNRPGLVIVNYGAQKGRDRSHYEHFQAYHSRLYSQVEPSSVTPFTLPVLERALHATFIAWLRQTLSRPEAANTTAGDVSTFMASGKADFFGILTSRISNLGLDEGQTEKLLQDAERFLERAVNFASQSPKPERWQTWEMDREAMPPLQIPYGKVAPHDWNPDRILKSPTSMRGVDSECPLVIRHHQQD